MKITGYSKALYSSWIYYSPDRVLFDAGESVSSIMGNKSFAIKHVFLSHGHTDHIAGLVGLINIRNTAMGDKAKQLTIYYPANNFHICELMNYLHRTNTNLSYPLEWIPLKPGDKVQVFGPPDSRNSRFVQTFPTEHTRRENSLGYNIVEQRQRLRKKYKDLSQHEIEQMAKNGQRDKLMETYHQKLFSYGGDSVPLNPKYVKQTEVLCHDTTFLHEEDRKEYKHATLQEAIEVAKEAGVKKELLAIHISSRYGNSFNEIKERVVEEKGETNFKINLIKPGKIFRI